MIWIETEPGVRVAVQDINPLGNKTVLFLHGWPLNHLTFEYQYDVFPQSGVRCVGVDLRGYGESSKPWGGYNYDRMADDVRVVVDSMGLDGFTLAGHSMGGAIAIRYMARHGGHRASRLALLAAAAPSFTQRPGFPWGMARQQADRLIANLYRDRPQAVQSFGQMFFAQPVTASFMEWFRDTGLAAAGYSTIHSLEALRDEDLSQDLGKIAVPTGIFHGVLDKICPYQLAIEMNKAIPGSLLYRFDGSGHAIYYDELDRFNQTFLKFIGR